MVPESTAPYSRTARTGRVPTERRGTAPPLRQFGLADGADRPTKYARATHTHSVPRIGGRCLVLAGAALIGACSSSAQIRHVQTAYDAHGDYSLRVGQVVQFD